MKYVICLFFIVSSSILLAQEGIEVQSSTYKKRVLENVEVDFVSSYYEQDGDNAAVTGGSGTEFLMDAAQSLVVAIPLNEDDVLIINAGISAYTSASSSNINPFDGKHEADPFVASSGASSQDAWNNGTGSYRHSSDDRNNIWSAKLSFSKEFDYRSLGAGGSYARLFNEKNSELSLNVNLFVDSWKLLYPFELRLFANGVSGLNNYLFRKNRITGNPLYSPTFEQLTSSKRNSYSLGVTFSQIISKRLQGAITSDIVLQNGLLSTPFQRVYFSDVENSYLENFHLADDIERLPDSRFKLAIGGRLNYYINEVFVVRSFYRYYTDDWKISSHTVSLEVPIKIGGQFTFYPSYRFYNQSAADYFAPYDQNISTDAFYTSDYDLSKFQAHQYGFGISYIDIFTQMHLAMFGLKSIDVKFNRYNRNIGLKAFTFAFGLKFLMY